MPTGSMESCSTLRSLSTTVSTARATSTREARTAFCAATGSFAARMRSKDAKACSPLKPISRAAPSGRPSR